MLVSFVKYEGAGNDFILIDDREELFSADARLIAALCDRHFGIGADGLMTLQRSVEMDCSMRYYNADGSPGEMCGNGARCFALFAEHLGIGGETKYFDATDGMHTARIRRAKNRTGEIELGMINVSEIRSGKGWWFLNTGVPHYVEFTEELDVLTVLKGHSFVYFTSNKSSILELCDWMDRNPFVGSPFKECRKVEFSASVNYQAKYTDMMLYTKPDEVSGIAA